MICPKCGKRTIFDFVKCRRCGYETSENSVPTHSTNTDVPLGSYVCEHCGHRFNLQQLQEHATEIAKQSYVLSGKSLGVTWTGSVYTFRDGYAWCPSCHPDAPSTSNADRTVCISSDVDPKGPEGVTAFFFASRLGRLEEVQRLLDGGVDINSYQDGETALTTAIILDNIEIVQFLLSKGANVNLKDRYGNTPLTLAMKYEYKKKIAELLQKAGGTK